ncbi:transcriptional regulator [Lachnospiraceae bacterium JC7]|nr:transcriptional regulator [Lachnospiraceae bacterium JC7]
MKYEDELIYKAAWYYYVENMTQQEISEKLGLSRMKVVRLLDAAKETGAVQFRILTSNGMNFDLEEKLTGSWNLSKAIVIPTPQDLKNLNENLAVAAANYIATIISDQSFINMGYGDTPSRVLNHLAAIAESPVSVVSLTGGVNYYLPNAVSSIFKAKLHLYPTPLLISSPEACRAILQEPGVQEIRRMTKLASLSIVGIGGMNSDATVLSNSILNSNDFTYLSMQGAVGDILTHFIDKDGNQIHTSFDDRLVSTPLDTLRELNNVIGIAGGPQKIAVIKAALRGHYLNTLITDENTARHLLTP